MLLCYYVYYKKRRCLCQSPAGPGFFTICHRFVTGFVTIFPVAYDILFSQPLGVSAPIPKPKEEAL